MRTSTLILGKNQELFRSGVGAVESIRHSDVAQLWRCWLPVPGLWFTEIWHFGGRKAYLVMMLVSHSRQNDALGLKLEPQKLGVASPSAQQTALTGNILMR
jgi:hypothetical protein